MNNSSMLRADRGTHLKIVVVQVICAAIAAVIGTAARVSPANDRMETSVVTVGKPVTAGDGASIR